MKNEKSLYLSTLFAALCLTQRRGDQTPVNEEGGVLTIIIMAEAQRDDVDIFGTWVGISMIISRLERVIHS